ncbi:MAG TPA: ATP-binding protein [Sphingobacteriaceae bacterium]
MKLRTKYLLFVMILHLTTLVLTFYVFRENKVLFLVAEVFILISLYLSWVLYKQLLQPLRTLLQGIHAISDKDFTVKFIPTGKFEMDQLIGVYNRMIDSLRAERKLQEEQHLFLEKLISTSPTGIIILDYDHQITAVNPRALTLLGLKERDLVRKTLEAISHPILNELQGLEPGESKTVSITGKESYKCQKSSFIDRGFPRYFIMIEEMSAEIMLAEKKAYGKVIRMMAHEVNNTIGPVNSIMNSAMQIQRLNGETGRELQYALQVAIERNDNLNAFMRNLAEVVKLPPPNRKDADLNHLASTACKLMELRAWEKGIGIRYRLAAGSVNVRADIQQLEQVLINILKNAIEAIEEPEGGIIEIETGESPARLIVRDNGKGIPSDLEQHLFTSFFSTKKDGQGVGLTLIREILMNHGAEFSLRTSAGGFTEFTIRFGS